jgi:hypothetical protein
MKTKPKPGKPKRRRIYIVVGNNWESAHWFTFAKAAKSEASRTHGARVLTFEEVLDSRRAKA